MLGRAERFHSAGVVPLAASRGGSGGVWAPRVEPRPQRRCRWGFQQAVCSSGWTASVSTVNYDSTCQSLTLPLEVSACSKPISCFMVKRWDNGKSSNCSILHVNKQRGRAREEHRGEVVNIFTTSTQSPAHVAKQQKCCLLLLSDEIT